MPKILSRATPSKPEPLTAADRKLAKVNAWVKEHLAKERAAEVLKREELKALRTGKGKS